MRFGLVLSALGIGLLVHPLFADQTKNLDYLALGDSIAFGFNPLLVNPKAPTPASLFIGYPEILAGVRTADLWVSKLTNAACPGETSASFRAPNAAIVNNDNGCNNSRLDAPSPIPPFDPNYGYKDINLLHVNIAPSESQLDFALHTLRSDKEINLITLSLGGNDLLLLQERCKGEPLCISFGLPDVLKKYGTNLSAILTALREEGKFKGTTVLVTTYSLNYSINNPINVLQTAAILALNAKTLQVAREAKGKVVVADAFGAFALASIPFGLDPCRAGLLVKLPNGACDVHPSPAGAALLAKTVLNAIQ